MFWSNKARYDGRNDVLFLSESGLIGLVDGKMLHRLG